MWEEVQGWEWQLTLSWPDGKKNKRPAFGAVRPSSEPPSARLAIIALQTPTLPEWTRQHISLSTPKHSAVTPKANRCMGCLSEHFSPACAFECTLFPFCLKIQILVMHDHRRSEQNFISCNMEKDMEKDIWLSAQCGIRWEEVTGECDSYSNCWTYSYSILWKHSLCFYK